MTKIFAGLLMAAVIGFTAAPASAAMTDGHMMMHHKKHHKKHHRKHHMMMHKMMHDEMHKM